MEPFVGGALQTMRDAPVCAVPSGNQHINKAERRLRAGNLGQFRPIVPGENHDRKIRRFTQPPQEITQRTGLLERLPAADGYPFNGISRRRDLLK